MKRGRSAIARRDEIIEDAWEIHGPNIDPQGFHKRQKCPVNVRATMEMMHYVVQEMIRDELDRYADQYSRSTTPQLKLVDEGKVFDMSKMKKKE